MNVDDYLDKKNIKGYVYFIYSKVLNKIYVGESIDTYRIDIYRSIINEKVSINRIRLYNYYTKHNLINYELAGDLVNYKNEFEIICFQTKYYKHLEKTYIKYLWQNGYDLYNRKLYKSHKYEVDEVDATLIEKMIKRRRL